MINDMASLKLAMEQMDAEDATVAQAGKDRAAQILADAGLSFSRLGGEIEQHRLLLRPRIVASIKRMDQPAMLGDAAFRDAAASLRKEGQSFRQIAEALELRNDRQAAAPIPDVMRRRMVAEFDGEPDEPEGRVRRPSILRVILYPLAIAVIMVVLVSLLREFADGSFDGRRVGDTPGRREAASSADQPSSAASTAASSDQAGPPGKTASSATEPAPAAAGNAPATVPPAATPPRADGKSADARSVPPSIVASNDRARPVRLRIFEDFMPAQLRRSSRYAGPCRGGIGGCYWGGGQY